MPLVTVSPSVRLLLTRDDFGNNAPGVRLMKSDTEPRIINGLPDLRKFRVQEYGFELSHTELSWILSLATIQTWTMMPTIFQFNGINLCVASYKHVTEHAQHFKMPWDGLVLWRTGNDDNDEGAPFYSVYYLSGQVFQELYELWPNLALVQGVFEICPEMTMHDTFPRFTWANLCVELCGLKTPDRYIKIEDTVRDLTIRLTQRLAHQLIKAGNATDGSVLHFHDELANKLEISLGIFTDGKLRFDTIVMSPRDFANLRSIVNLLSVAY
jgi:hypothetical protein